MAVVPPWLRGRNLTAFTATGMTEGSDGTLSDATGAGIQVVLLKWDEWDMESNPATEEISASDMIGQHDVILQERNEFSFQTILLRIKASGDVTDNVDNPIMKLATTYDAVRLNVTYGAHSWVFYGRRGPVSQSIRKGRSTERMRLLPLYLGSGSPNPAYS